MHADDSPQGVNFARRNTAVAFDRGGRLAPACRPCAYRRRGAVAFRPDGHSDLAALRTKASAAAASFVAFDLLMLDGEDLRQHPLEERREALSRLVAGIDAVVFSDALAADGALVFPRRASSAARNRFKASRKPILERAKPPMAQAEEPGVLAFSLRTRGAVKRRPRLRAFSRRRIRRAPNAQRDALRRSRP